MMHTVSYQGCISSSINDFTMNVVVVVVINVCNNNNNVVAIKYSPFYYEVLLSVINV